MFVGRLTRKKDEPGVGLTTTQLEEELYKIVNSVSYLSILSQTQSKLDESHNLLT